MWAVNPHLRSTFFQTLPDDRPLIIQLNGSDERELLSAALALSSHADAIDLNLGCTQKIAKRGRFGYFMANTDSRRRAALDIVRKLVESLTIPVTVKIRLLSDDSGRPDPQITAAFARDLEKCGVALIAVHGRHQRLDKSGDVDAAAIRAIVDAVSVPVIANGGVRSAADADALVIASGAAGAMVGHGLLNDPTMFDGGAAEFDPFAVAREYFALFREVGGDEIVAKRHLFMLFEARIRERPELAERLKERRSVKELVAFLDEVEGVQ
jgi:tRNA-dihydrouridine synthase 1